MGFVLRLNGRASEDVQVATRPEVNQTTVIVGWVKKAKRCIVRFKCEVVDTCEGLFKQGSYDSVLFSCVDVKHFR